MRNKGIAQVPSRRRWTIWTFYHQKIMKTNNDNVSSRSTANPSMAVAAVAVAKRDNRQLNSIVKDCHDYSSTAIVNRCRSYFLWLPISILLLLPFLLVLFTIAIIVQRVCCGCCCCCFSLTGCKLTGENALSASPLFSCWMAVACRTTIGECVFIVMQKSQEGGVKQRKTVLKLCRGDRSNRAVKCLPVLHCWPAMGDRFASPGDYSDMAAGRQAADSLWSGSSLRFLLLLEVM